MRSDEAIAMLRSFVEDNDPSPAAIDWMRCGLRRWIRAGATLSLPASLGLCPKAHSVSRALRNSWLCDAALQLEGSMWSRAGTLKREIARFSYRWPRLCNCPDAPLDLNSLDRALFLAFRYCADMPGSVQGVRDAIEPISSLLEPSEVIEKLGSPEASIAPPPHSSDRYAFPVGIRR